MRDDYPVPDYAAYIWIAGDQVCIGFPPTVGTKAHTVKFPNTENGLLVALGVLRERSRAPHNKLTIGNKCEPTGYMVERALAGDPRYQELLDEIKRTKDVSEKERAESIALLAELGL